MIFPETRSTLPGIAWPAITNDAAAHLQALLFQLDRSQWLPAERLHARQLGQISQVLRHALTTVPRYAETLRGLDIERLDWEGFRALPLLKRKDLQGAFDSLASRAIPASHGEVVDGLTSGSTGMPVRFLQTAVTQLFWNALTLREHLWQERDFSGKLAAIRIKAEARSWPDWGMPTAALFHTGPAVTLSVQTPVAQQLDWLVRENPDYLVTHASNLLALAELSLHRGVRLPRLRQVRSFSEALSPHLREHVHAAWGVDVADCYSCNEAGYIALQCPEHDHYHVQAEHLLTEVLDDAGRACEPGETGRVVITTLHNFAMPLIRYELGDYAEVGEACACGRGLPVLRRIHGRRRNMLVLPDGSRHWPSFPAEVWREVAPVEQFRLIQRAAEEIAVEYVMARDLTPEETRRLEIALSTRFAYPFHFTWTRRETLERGSGYKFEDFVSEV